MRLIRDVDTQNGARVPTGVLNEMLARATARVQPPTDKGRRLKIFYLTQASTGLPRLWPLSTPSPCSTSLPAVSDQPDPGEFQSGAYPHPPGGP